MTKRPSQIPAVSDTGEPVTISVDRDPRGVAITVVRDRDGEQLSRQVYPPEEASELVAKTIRAYGEVEDTSLTRALLAAIERHDG